MMGVSVVVSTANDRILGLKFQPSLQEGVEYVLVHQVYSDNLLDTDYTSRVDLQNAVYIKQKYSGLSKSRNAGLQAAKCKYAYIMDDDVVFDIEKIQGVARWMDANNIDIATCQFLLENGKSPKKYRQGPFKHNIFSSTRVSSIEICVNLDRLKERGIEFDERFGLGTDFPSGEEYIFLTDCIRAGLNVWFYPVVTGVHPNITSGMDFYSSPKKILAKRQMLKRVFPRSAPLYIFLFWLRKIPRVYRSGYLLLYTKVMLFGMAS